METIIVKSKIKEVSGDKSVSAEFLEVLNNQAHDLVKKAIARAKANGRKTVQGRDIYLGDLSEEMLIVKSKLKESFKDMSFSADFFNSLSSVLVWNISQAGARAEANKRKTIQARDL